MFNNLFDRGKNVIYKIFILLEVQLNVFLYYINKKNLFIKVIQIYYRLHYFKTILLPRGFLPELICVVFLFSFSVACTHSKTHPITICIFLVDCFGLILLIRYIGASLGIAMVHNHLITSLGGFGLFMVVLSYLIHYLVQLVLLFLDGFDISEFPVHTTELAFLILAVIINILFTTANIYINNIDILINLLVVLLICVIITIFGLVGFEFYYDNFIGAIEYFLTAAYYIFFLGIFTLFLSKLLLYLTLDLLFTFFQSWIIISLFIVLIRLTDGISLSQSFDNFIVPVIFVLFSMVILCILQFILLRLLPKNVNKNYVSLWKDMKFLFKNFWKIIWLNIKFFFKLLLNILIIPDFWKEIKLYLKKLWKK